MLLELLLAGSVFSAVNVDVLPLERPAASGELVSFDAKRLVIKVDGQPTEYDVAELISVSRSKPPAPAAAAEVGVILIDGTRLACTSYTAASGKAAITLRSGATLELPTATVHSVRLRSQNEDLQKQWAEIEAREAAGDRIVLRKTSTVSVPSADGLEKVDKEVVALDWLEGIIYDVTAAAVEFKYKDTLVSVNRAKLDGLFYFHAAGGRPEDPQCQVIDAEGSQWNARSVELAGDSVQLVGTTGIKASVPLDKLIKLDFSAGKILYLSDAQAESVEWTSYFDSGVLLPSLQQWFAPQKDRGFAGSKLTLPNPDDHGKPKQYDKGLAVHSRTELVYRVPEGFKRLLATGGIDMRVRPGGNVRLVITGDGKELLQQVVTGKDAQPLKVDLDIAGVRRLTILVDYGEDADIADHLNLCNARITK
jgi:hypothetical protein